MKVILLCVTIQIATFACAAPITIDGSAKERRFDGIGGLR
jgi:hypothetical protein